MLQRCWVVPQFWNLVAARFPPPKAATLFVARVVCMSRLTFLFVCGPVACVRPPARRLRLACSRLPACSLSVCVLVVCLPVRLFASKKRPAFLSCGDGVYLPAVPRRRPEGDRAPDSPHRAYEVVSQSTPCYDRGWQHAFGLFISC